MRNRGQITSDEHPCLSDALFIPGFDAGAAAVHDARAIAGGKTARLTYLGKQGKIDSGVPERWYRNYPVCAARPPGEAPGTNDCDEYPFFSTVEGGPGASLERLDADQNQLEGRKLGVMYGDAKCRMRTPDQIGRGTTQFMVIPMAVPTTDEPIRYAGPPTGHICGPSVPFPTGGGDGGGGGVILT
jgi:hypothetical protein